MPLPSFDKTWQFSLNNAITAGAAVGERAIKKLVTELTGFALSPWVYVGGSSRLIPPIPGPETWGGWGGEVVWGNPGDAHSWVVLEQAAMGMQMCIDLDSAGGAYYAASVYVSTHVDGFTGGSRWFRPTAINEVEITAGGAWLQTLNTTQVQLHIWMSTDGKCTRIIPVTNNVAHCLWMIDTIKNPRAGLTSTWMAGVHNASSATQWLTYGTLYDGLTSVGPAMTVEAPDGTRVRALFTSDTFGQNAAGQSATVVDDIDGSWPLLEMGIFSKVAGARGMYGQVYDTWWGSDGVAMGDDYDDTGNMSLGQLGVLVMPSNGVLLATV